MEERAGDHRGCTAMKRPDDEVPAVAACTTQAAHRRDHRHDETGESCHPHAVEVVHLGHRAVAVCHDCGTDSGFLPEREAERLASGHRDQTRASSVPFRAPLAG
jgi:hypothetical protein